MEFCDSLPESIPLLSVYWTASPLELCQERLVDFIYKFVLIVSQHELIVRLFGESDCPNTFKKLRVGRLVMRNGSAIDSSLRCKALLSWSVTVSMIIC